MKRTQLITTADLEREEVDFLIKEAEELRGKTTDDLSGAIVATLFFEPSTRTRLSFETAVHKLGGKVITVANAQSTSMKKGETLTDTINVVEKFADMIVMRHPKEGSAAEGASETEKPFVNAGDGPNQHPTQALLDMLTIQRERGTIDGLTIGFVGDLKFGRTVHSLIHLLVQYKVKLIFVSPDQLKLPKKYIELCQEKGVEFVESGELNKHVPDMDILYMTRVQQERFENLEEYSLLKGTYVLTPEVVEMGKEDLKILHPLPRIDEIVERVDRMPQAAYFRQVENGVYMRMAILRNLWKNATNG